MEAIQSYVARQMQTYDRNRDGMIQLSPIPIIAPYAEVGTGRTADFMRQAAAFGNGYMLDSYSFGQAVENRIDTNHDGQIDLLEKIVGFIKFGLW
jgi:hypothetical protein